MVLKKWSDNGSFELIWKTSLGEGEINDGGNGMNQGLKAGFKEKSWDYVEGTGGI